VGNFWKVWEQSDNSHLPFLIWPITPLNLKRFQISESLKTRRFRKQAFFRNYLELVSPLPFLIFLRVDIQLAITHINGPKFWMQMPLSFSRPPEYSIRKSPKNSGSL